MPEMPCLCLPGVFFGLSRCMFTRPCKARGAWGRPFPINMFGFPAQGRADAGKRVHYFALYKGDLKRYDNVWSSEHFWLVMDIGGQRGLAPPRDSYVCKFWVESINWRPTDTKLAEHVYGATLLTNWRRGSMECLPESLYLIISLLSLSTDRLGEEPQCRKVFNRRLFVGSHPEGVVTSIKPQMNYEPS